MFQEKKSQNDLTEEEKADIVYSIIDEFSANPAETNIDIVPSIRQDIGIDAAALFVSDPRSPHYKQIIIDASRFNNNFYDLIEDVLHELEHFNQVYEWETGGVQAKMRILGDYQLPQELEKAKNNQSAFAKALTQYSLYAIQRFWLKAYGYQKAPHEAEARKFAAKNFSKVLDKHFS